MFLVITPCGVSEDRDHDGATEDQTSGMITKLALNFTPSEGADSLSLGAILKEM